MPLRKLAADTSSAVEERAAQKVSIKDALCCPSKISPQALVYNRLQRESSETSANPQHSPCADY